MTNIIWIILILGGIIISFFTGKVDELGSIILNSSNDAFNIFLKLSLTIFLWSGIFNILIDTGVISKLSKKLSKILKFLFPDLNSESKALEYISLTVISNILGLGIASSSTGIKAFELLKKENQDNKFPSKAMITFLILNISSFSIFPISIITIRNSYGGKSDIKFFILIMLTTFIGSILSILIDKLFQKLGNKKWSSLFSIY